MLWTSFFFFKYKFSILNTKEWLKESLKPKIHTKAQSWVWPPKLSIVAWQRRLMEFINLCIMTCSMLPLSQCIGKLIWSLRLVQSLPFLLIQVGLRTAWLAKNPLTTAGGDVSGVQLSTWQYVAWHCPAIWWIFCSAAFLLMREDICCSITISLY